MPTDPPPLPAQEAEGLYKEALEQIVDGLAADVEAGHVTQAFDVLTTAWTVIAGSVYGTDPEFAKVALTYGETTSRTEEQEFQLLELARSRMLMDVMARFRNTPAHAKLYPDEKGK